MPSTLLHPLAHPVAPTAATRREFLGGGAFLGALLVTACGSGESSGAPAVSASSARAVTDGRGERVELDTRPDRVVTVSGESLDLNAVLDLGLAPVGCGTPSREQPWAADDLAGSEQIPASASINIERIAALEPELIVCSQPDESLFPQLAGIAPLFVLEYGGDWRARTRTLGRLLWRDDEAEESISAFDSALADGRRTLGARDGEQLAVICFYDPTASQIFQSTREDGIGEVLAALGFAPLPEPEEPGSGYNVFSSELVDRVTGDRLVIQDFSDGEDDYATVTDRFLDSELGRRIPAAVGGIVRLSTAGTNASYLKTPRALSYLVGELGTLLA